MIIIIIFESIARTYHSDLFTYLITDFYIEWIV